jgi:DNA-binding transcriptional ArsR family regulator
MDDVMQALAQPRRREILQLVRAHEMSAGNIATHFDVTRPAISQHLKVLRDCRLVSERRVGTRRYYRARPEGLADLRKFLELFWDYRLGLLKDAAESDHMHQTAVGAGEDEDDLS